MDLRDLQYFSAVVRTRYFRRAAKEMGITQPAITKAIQRLERNLGAILLQRTTRGAAPTQAGAALMVRVRQIENSIEAAQRQVRDLAEGKAGHVRIGAGATMLADILPNACAELLEVHPLVTLKIVGDMNDNLLKSLRSGELDLVVSGLPEHPAQDLVQEPLMKDELCIITRAGHPIVGPQRCSLGQVASLRWALPARPVFSRVVLDRSFTDRGFPPPKVAIESNSARMLLETVARSDLATFQPVRNVMRASGLKLRVLNVKGARWFRTIGISYRENTYFPPAATRILAILRASAASASPGARNK